MVSLGVVNLVLNRPIGTQYVLLKLTGLITVSIDGYRVEDVIFKKGLILWGNGSGGSEMPENISDVKWEEGLMDEGEHSFPFELGLTEESLPSSIEVCALHLFLLTH
jgi:hypothetical protein